MLSGREATRVVNGILREEVLILGGLLAVHDVPRGFVNQFLLSLERVHQRARRRLQAADRDARPEQTAPRFDRDPEIQRFLERLNGSQLDATAAGDA